MDGNRRWAKSKGIPIELGHKAGSKTIEKIAKESKNIGVKYLTLYVFSNENWNRSEKEVSVLMGLLRNYLKNETKKLLDLGIRISFIGNRSRLDKDIVVEMERVEKISINNPFHLILALSYSSRDEIREAAIKAAKSFATLNEEPPYDYIDRFISTNILEVPDPDILIRTSGEHRISNFLLWQIAYSELYFVTKHWPDFDEKDLMLAIEEYNKRERRYGT